MSKGQTYWFRPVEPGDGTIETWNKQTFLSQFSVQSHHLEAFADAFEIPVVKQKGARKEWPVVELGAILFLYKCLARRGVAVRETLADVRYLLDNLHRIRELFIYYGMEEDEEETATSIHPDRILDPKERNDYLRGTRQLIGLAQDVQQLVDQTEMSEAMVQMKEAVLSTLSGLPDLVESRMTASPEQMEQLHDIAVEVSTLIAEKIQHVGLPRSKPQ